MVPQTTGDDRTGCQPLHRSSICAASSSGNGPMTGHGKGGGERRRARKEGAAGNPIYYPRSPEQLLAPTISSAWHTRHAEVTVADGRLPPNAFAWHSRLASTHLREEEKTRVSKRNPMQSEGLNGEIELGQKKNQSIQKKTLHSEGRRAGSWPAIRPQHSSRP